MSFRALLVEKSDPAAKPNHRIAEVELDDLPQGDVVVDIEWSTLNYKDGLCLGPGGGLVKTYPHVAGIDFAGTVSASSSDKFRPGDKVVLTGWRVGETHWGGYAQKARVKAEWLVPLPKGLSTRSAMAIGTAGLTAMLALMALERQGLAPDNGRPVLVTGASGGVGSVATLLLSERGYEVAAVTGRAENADYLRALGATSIVARDELAEASKRPLEKENWAGAIDSVGGEMLGRVLGQIAYGGSVAAVGLAGGASFSGSVIPFILRGVNLLGIDSVMQPYENRVAAWARLAEHLALDQLEEGLSEAGLDKLPELGRDILKGRVRGRVLVDPNR